MTDNRVNNEDRDGLNASLRSVVEFSAQLNERLDGYKNALMEIRDRQQRALGRDLEDGTR